MFKPVQFVLVAQHYFNWNPSLSHASLSHHPMFRGSPSLLDGDWLCGLWSLCYEASALQVYVKPLHLCTCMFFFQIANHFFIWECQLTVLSSLLAANLSMICILGPEEVWHISWVSKIKVFVWVSTCKGMSVTHIFETKCFWPYYWLPVQLVPGKTTADYCYAFHLDLDFSSQWYGPWPRWLGIWT